MLPPTIPDLKPTYTDVGRILTAQPELTAAGPELIEQCIVQAESEINGHLSLVYRMPFATIPPLVTTLANDIAIYRLYTSRMYQSPPRDTQTPWVDRYKAAVALLMRMSEGAMLLIGADGLPMAPASGQAAESNQIWSTTMNYVPTFGEGNDQGFVVDRDKTEAESARRKW